jgi:hypothetical protein
MFNRAAPLIAIFGLATSVSGFGTPALALDHSSLGQMLFGPRTGAPAIARYQVDAGESFVLDAVPGKPAFLKFEDSPEIWALHATSGPRGDIIYKNDMDQPVVRATRLGGVTLFTPEQPDGMPAAFLGQGAAPRMDFDITPEVLFHIFAQASTRASRMAQHLVMFEAPDATASPQMFADAAIITSQAFIRVGSRGKEGRMLVARFSKVEFNTGKGPNAFTMGEVVRVIIAPDQGVAGRPSSERIASVLARK